MRFQVIRITNFALPNYSVQSSCDLSLTETLDVLMKQQNIAWKCGHALRFEMVTCAH